MNTALQYPSPRLAWRRKPLAAAVATWLSAGLLIAQPACATDGDENAPVTKTAAAAPVALGHGPMQMTISMTPAPATAPQPPAALSAALRGPNCTGPIREENTVVVPLGKSVLVPLEEPVRNRTLGNPAVAQATMLSPRTLYVVGQSVGTTNMIVQGRSGSCQIVDVVVNVDAGGLLSSLMQLLPGEHDIHVTTAADSLVLSGRVSTAQAAQQAVEIAKVYSASAAGGDGKSGGVINMLSVDSPQQVMLEVKVAEVDKTLIDQLGAAVNIQGGFGSWTGALVSNLLAGVSSAFGFSKANNKPLAVAVDAQKTDDLVKILAEPNLVTISGQEATFLAGGEVFIPVPQSSGGTASTIVLQQEEFGVGLKFTPTVLGNGKINLRVAPEVSELSSTGVTLSATNAGGTSILPLITTRRASTTVQINDGESFAIGGLIKNNVTGALKAVPGLGEVPVLGALLRSTSFQQDRTELVFIVTPHLVKPLATANLPLPTDSFTQPNEADVYATGNMEGRGAGRATGAAPRGSQPPAPQPPAPAGLSGPARGPTAATPADTVAPADPATAAPVESQTAPHVEPVPTPVSLATPLPSQPVPPGRSSNARADKPDARVLRPAQEDAAAQAARIEREAARIAANDAGAQPDGAGQRAGALKQ
jgi:pilus assembly protein CpaC